MNEERARFLKAILDRIPLDRIAEIHFFPVIRQGHMETGVAVIAAEPETAMANPEPAVASAIGNRKSPEIPPAFGLRQLQDVRHVVYSAAYRLTRKGLERGKWEVDIKPEADAPLPTVDVVVRGVQERAGEGIEPQRYTAHELKTLLKEPAWQHTT